MVLRSRTSEVAPGSPWPVGLPGREEQRLIYGITVGQVSQWVCPARHRHHLFESNLFQQADVGQQLIHEAVAGAPHGFTSRIEVWKQGEPLLARWKRRGPGDRLSGRYGCDHCCLQGGSTGCDVTSGFPLSHPRSFFSAGATVLRNRSLRDLASGAGRKDSLTLVHYHCFCKADFGQRCVHWIKCVECFPKEPCQTGLRESKIDI